MSAEISSSINLDNALLRLGNRPKLLRDMMTFFLEDCDEMICQIESSFASLDLNTLCRVSHTLKGSASTFDASECVAAALAVEQYARQRQVVPLPDAISTLKEKVAALCDVLRIERDRITL